MPEFREVTIGQCRLIHGDNLEVLPTLEENSVDTIITDPPYGISLMSRRWDHGIPGVDFWKQALRVAKPGATMLAFGGTRTFHRLACAIEDAGWEFRDTIMWVYGSGMPKSLSISKSIDKMLGVVERNGYGEDWDTGSSSARPRYDAPATATATAWDGWGSSIKPAWEPVLVFMKALDGTFANNAITHGVSGFNIDAGRIPANGESLGGGQNNPSWDYTGKHDGYQRPWMLDQEKRLSIQERSLANTQKSEALGRFPANLIHDGSDSVVGLFPDSAGQIADISHSAPSQKTSNVYGAMKREGEPSQDRRYTENGGTNFAAKPGARRLDSGSAARFFYAAKASKSDRGGAFNTHPTVKPQSLMEYLCKLTSTPTGGTVLDMFMGSGSTGVACVATGRKFIGIELNDTPAEPFFTIAGRRMSNAVNGTIEPPNESPAESAATEPSPKKPAQRSLFDEDE